MRIPRIRTGLCLLACGAVLTGCAAAAKGPGTAVTTPAVGRPPAPASAQAAVSTEAFTPYAALGESSNDGLAPGESLFTFAADCMTAAGYPSAAYSTSFVLSDLGGAINIDPAASPWGAWGYLGGAADAQQYGFQISPTSSLSALLGIDTTPDPASPSPAEQAAASSCITTQQNLANPIEDGPLAVIGTVSNDIAADVAQDPAVKAATRAWLACMAKNGYSFPDPQDVYSREQGAMYPNQSPREINTETVNTGALPPVSASANQAQLAVAVIDADCTQSSDLAGIYFAVQASYEQQLVTANQQALANAVSQYRADYKKEQTKLAAQLRAAKTQPFPQVKPPAARATHPG
jgi:hypothetical protein